MIERCVHFRGHLGKFDFQPHRRMGGNVGLYAEMKRTCEMFAKVNHQFLLILLQGSPVIHIDCIGLDGFYLLVGFLIRCHPDDPQRMFFQNTQSRQKLLAFAEPRTAIIAVNILGIYPGEVCQEDDYCCQSFHLRRLEAAAICQLFSLYAFGRCLPRLPVPQNRRPVADPWKNERPLFRVYRRNG